MSKLKVLIIATSLRAGSFSKKLAKIAAKNLESSGQEVTFADLADFPLPLYNQDISVSDFPKEAFSIEKMMREHHVWIIAAPEYNYSMSGATKNLIDWVSRIPDNKPNFQLFANKVIGLMSSSPGPSAGSNCVRHLRESLSTLGCVVIPSQVCLGNSFSAFNDKDELLSIDNQKLVEKMLTQLVEFGSKV